VVEGINRHATVVEGIKSRLARPMWLVINLRKNVVRQKFFRAVFAVSFFAMSKRGVHNPSPFAFSPLPAAQIKSPASVPP
jgi:hypothetical protein